MSLSSLLLAVWLILVGLTWLTWVAIDSKFLGAWAAITGVVMLIEHWHPLAVPVGRRPA